MCLVIANRKRSSFEMLRDTHDENENDNNTNNSVTRDEDSANRRTKSTKCINKNTNKNATYNLFVRTASIKYIFMF